MPRNASDQQKAMIPQHYMARRLALAASSRIGGNGRIFRINPTFPKVLTLLLPISTVRAFSRGGSRDVDRRFHCRFASMTKAAAAWLRSAEGRAMNSSLTTRQLVLATGVILLSQAVASVAARADNSGLHFQRPGAARAQNEQANKNFRRPGLQRTAKPQAEARQATPKVARARKPAKTRQVAAQRVAKELPKPRVLNKKKAVRRGRARTAASSGPVQYDLDMPTGLRLVSHGCDLCEGPSCTCEVSCGMTEPSCGLYEPGCGIAEPSCGCSEPSCGICEPSCGLYEPGCGVSQPGCGIAEPGCGMAGGCGEGVGCGSCVARPGPDYWCFPGLLTSIQGSVGLGRRARFSRAA